MSIQLETSATIDRPIEEVFEYVTAVEKNAEWEPRMVESPAPKREMAIGTQWHPEIEGLRGTEHTTMECIAYDPPTKFGYTTPEGMMGGRLKTEEAIFTFSEVGDSTRLEWSGTIQVNGLLRLLQPFLARNLQSDVDTSLENLKSVLEGPDTVSATGPESA